MMKKVYIRIVSLFSCIVILFLAVIPAFAQEVVFHEKTFQFLELFAGSDEDSLEVSSYLDVIFSRSDSGCPSSPDGIHFWKCVDVFIGLSTNKFFVECTFCRMNYCTYQGIDSDSLTTEDLPDVYAEYVSDLDYTFITNEGLFSIFPTGWHFIGDTLYVNSSCLQPYLGGFTVDGVALATNSSDGARYAYVASETFSLPSGLYSINLSSYKGASTYHAGLYSGYTYSFIIQGSDDGVSWSDVANAHITNRSFAYSENKPTVEFSTIDYPYSQYRIYVPLCVGVYGFDAGDKLFAERSGFIQAIALADSTVDSDSSSRPMWFTDFINEHNSLFDYTKDEDAVNFFMGSYDDNGELTDFYNMSVYDEDTMIFTEPVTGAQYQSTGWVYDYLTRSYDIALESGTFLIGESDITQIICLYGDEEVRIGYYDAEGTQIQEDSYAYVMVSQSSCALDGHSYTVETIKEATCTSSGERKYTCSVCGDEKIEDVPMAEHKATYSVFKEATCTDSGIALYTCADCGTQYTDEISPLGHDWLPIDSVDSSYALPDDVHCPDCDSIEFSSELDRESAIYTCTCSACGSEWLESAEVTTGYTTYECSRCGARKTERLDQADNGLFTSIGNFFADGIRWCTDKLTQLVDSLTSMLDTFNSYLEEIGEHSSSYPSFLGQIVALLPEDMMAVIWFMIVAAVVVAVIQFWFR